MRAAAGAMHFGARHAEGAVDAGFDGALDRRVEARPPGSAFELGSAFEQGLSAAGAGEDAGALPVQERAAARRLGAMTAHDFVLLGRQDGAPFGVGVGDGKAVLFHDILLRSSHHIGAIAAPGTRIYAARGPEVT